jgi:hypothetical protein
MIVSAFTVMLTLIATVSLFIAVYAEVTDRKLLAVLSVSTFVASIAFLAKLLGFL